MQEGLRLLAAGPKWFIEAAISPPDLIAGPKLLGALVIYAPLIGLISLVAGVSLAVWRRDRRLSAFVLPFLVSEVLLFAAGAADGKANETLAGVAVACFLLLQIGLALYLPFRFKGARSSAITLSLFSIIYGLMTAVIAGMAFTGDWS